MPELPEVETTRRGLAPHVEGRRVTGVVLRRPDLRWPIPAEVGEQLPGRRIAAVRRVDLRGDAVTGDEAGVVESVKAASDIYAPIGGTVLAVNEALADTPEQVNGEPYEAWFFKLQPSDPAELEGLLDAAGYQAVCSADA